MTTYGVIMKLVPAVRASPKSSILSVQSLFTTMLDGFRSFNAHKCISFLQSTTDVWISAGHHSTLQSTSNSPTIPRLFQVLPTEEVIFIKPHQPPHRSTRTPEWILWHYLQSIMCMSTLLNTTQVMFIL